LSEKEKLFYLINLERRDRGLKIFDGEDSSVSAIGDNFLNSIFLCGYNSSAPHNDPCTNQTFRERMVNNLNIGGKFTIIAEVLAFNINPAGAVYEWMYNDKECCNWSHRNTILSSKFDERTLLGVSVLKNDNLFKNGVMYNIDFVHPTKKFSKNIVLEVD